VKVSKWGGKPTELANQSADAPAFSAIAVDAAAVYWTSTEGTVSKTQNSRGEHWLEKQSDRRRDVLYDRASNR